MADRDVADRDVAEQAAASIHGHAAAGYESLLTVFAENWDLLGEVGAAAALYVDGKEVFHAWGGLADQDAGRPWMEDTAAVVFSTTKGITAICVHQLAERGVLDLDAPVAAYWPEFGAAGKERLPIRWVLSHRAGLFAVEEPLTLPEVLAARPVAEALARQRPMWEPGTAYLYHPLSYGYILGELVRRVTGMTLGSYLRHEVAGPVGADVWIGLPPEFEHRVARLVPPVDPEHEGVQPVIAAMAERDSVAARAFLGTVFPPGFLGDGTDFNSRAVHESEIPAAGGIATARGLARVYAATVGEVDGVRLLSPGTVEAARQVQSEGVPLGDGGAELRLSMGFMVNSAARRMPTAQAFGHWGYGGSVGLADPVRGFGFGYVPNQMLGGVGGDPRALRLIEEVERLTR